MRSTGQSVGLTLCALALAAVSFAAETDGRVRIEREIARMEDAVRAVEAKRGGEVSVTRFRGLVRSVNGTNVWTEAIQAALTNGARTVRIPAAKEPYCVDATLIVPSCRRILAEGATIRLLPPCDTVLLRNANAADGTLGCIDRATGDRDIFVVGGRWEDWQTKRAGYGRSGRFDDGVREKGTNFYGVSALLYFGNVTRLSVRDVTIAHAGGFAIQCGDTEDAVFENIDNDGRSPRRARRGSPRRRSRSSASTAAGTAQCRPKGTSCGLPRRSRRRADISSCGATIAVDIIRMGWRRTSSRCLSIFQCGVRRN